MTWWLCTDFDQHTTVGVVSAVWVEADDEDTAAAEALPHLDDARQVDSVGPPEPVSHVFVVATTKRVAYEVVAVPRRAELQCCGGIGDGRHSALCPGEGPAA